MDRGVQERGSFFASIFSFLVLFIPPPILLVLCHLVSFSFSLIIFGLSRYCSFVLFCIVFHVVFFFSVLSSFVLSASV